MPQLVGLLIAFVLVGTVMVALERWRPSIPGQRLLRRGILLDLAYWLFTPLVTRIVTRSGVVVAVVVLLLILGWPIDKASIEAGHGPVGAQPRWLQAIELVVLLDLIGYWMHRLFHTGRLWRFHAIHHSSEELDWLSAVRIHPINDMIGRIVPAIVMVLAGFSPTVLAGVLPAFALYAILLHANVDWDFGVLRKVIASPRFHRWHHTGEAEGRDKNFAGLLPVWDIIFCTWHMPARGPVRFGVDDPVPATLWGQLVWPFRSSDKARAVIRPRERGSGL